MPELVSDVLALLDAAGLRSAHVVGHDWGGAVAWTLAGRHPDRVRSLTVLSTPHPRALRAAMRSSSQAVRSLYMACFQLPALPEAALLAAGGAGLRTLLTRTGLPAEAAAGYVGRMREPGALSAALSWYRALPASRGAGAGRTPVPTTYVWGRGDPFFSATAARATAACVRGPFTSLELDAGHWLPETEPARVATAVLEQIDGSGR
jgi:pimeloyl-ACP methyl ester carboxylesterase